MSTDTSTPQSSPQIDLVTTARLFKYFSGERDLMKDLRVLYFLLKPHGLTQLVVCVESKVQDSDLLNLYPNPKYEIGRFDPKSIKVVKRYTQNFYSLIFKFYTKNDRKLKWILESPTAEFLTPLLEKRFVFELEKYQTVLWRKIFDSISSPHIIIDNEYNILKLNNSAGILSKAGLKNSKGQKCYSVLAHRSRPCRNCPILSSGLKTIRFDKSYISLSFPLKNQTSYGVYYLSIEEELQLLQEYISRFKLQKLGQSFDLHLEEILEPLKKIEKEVQEVPVDEDLSRFNYALTRAFSVIHNMISFLNPDAVSFSGETCSLEEVISKSLSICRPHLHNIVVDFNALSGVQTQIPGSQSVWIQIFFNLIKNAFQAMPKGGKIQIEIFDGNVSVRDTGTGISQHQLDNLFTPLFSTKKSNGTGLGLFIVKRLLERINCTINVKSKLGLGTEFVICFPLMEERSVFVHD